MVVRRGRTKALGWIVVIKLLLKSLRPCTVPGYDITGRIIDSRPHSQGKQIWKAAFCEVAFSDPDDLVVGQVADIEDVIASTHVICTSNFTASLT